MDGVLEGINPAYRPLFPVLREVMQGTLSHYSALKLKYPIDIFSCPISELRNFLAQVPIKTSLDITGSWIRNFKGIDLFTASDKEENTQAGSVLVPYLAPLLRTGWGAKERLAFAEGHGDLALEQLEESLRFFEIMGEGDLAAKPQANYLLKGSSAFFAQHLASLTPHGCARLRGMIEHWKAGAEIPESLLTEAMHEEQEALVREVLNDGSVPDREAEARQIAEMERKLDAGEQTPEEPAFELPVPAPLPPTPEALEKRKQVADAVAEDFVRLRTLLHDPFAILPSKSTRPKWLAGIVVEGYNGYGEAQLHEHKQTRLCLELLEAHLVIRQFQWEHDRLPKTLAELQSTERMTDPVTGKFFIYVIDGETYTLKSAGVAGIESDEEGNNLPTRPYDLLDEELKNPLLTIVYNSAFDEGTSSVDVEPNQKPPEQTGE